MTRIRFKGTRNIAISALAGAPGMARMVTNGAGKSINLGSHKNFSSGPGRTITAEAPPTGVPVAPKAKVPPIYILNGPNLNLLGTREPEVYGRTTLPQIGKMTAAQAKSHGLTTVFRQSNHEGELVEWIQEARTKASGVILNAGAYTHTSVALLDACRTLDKPLIEVHLSNPYARERFRRHSYISQAAKGVICGLGPSGYLAAIDALARYLKDDQA
jgi:3-dehydroquinate dehydratase II